MKVCHISFSFLIGGIENMVVDILNEQSKTVDTYLMIINKNYDKEILNRISDKVKIILINRPEGSKNLIYLLKAWLILLKLNPKVIHAHSPKLIGFLLFFKNKCIYTVHNIGISLKNFKLYKKLFAISKAVQIDLLERGNLASELVYNGIDFESFDYKKEYQIFPKNKFRIVQVSRLLHEQKGQDILLHAIQKLVYLHDIKNISVEIIGDGPSQDYLKRLCSKLQITEYVDFVGPKDRSWLYENLKNYHVLIQPSRFEGFGLTVIEAIAAGLPVIASNLDGPAEILENIQSATLFNIEDTNELTIGLINVLQDYQSQKIEEKCRVASKQLEGKFSVETTSKNYLTYYNQL